MRLDIRLLGPLEVAVGGRPVRLASRLRAVLAVLAMSPGSTVPVDRIAEALWAETELPSNPRASVQTYVARLRGVLGAEAIETDPAGYVLRAGPEDVDASRFTAMLDRAAAAGDPGLERQRLAEALKLWRGKPFEGVESARLHETLGPRLVERYLAAIERRVDLDLASDASVDLAPELSELTSRHPLREPLWARLLEALRLSGRQAEALERYELFRRRLASELGTDPGAELKAIHARLLAGHPAADPAAPAPRSGKLPGNSPSGAASSGLLPGNLRDLGVVPRQLPADIVGFAGRGTALSTMDELLAGAPGMLILAIGGAAGIGKTTLAVHFAHRVAARFPDGQLYANLRGFDPSGEPRPPGEVVRGFLDALGVPPHEVPAQREAQIALYRSLLAGRKMLVLLDNARNADQVRALLPGSPGCLALVTSRDRLSSLVAVEGARPVPLDVMPAQEARAMLGLRLGAQRIAADPLSAGQIVAHCEGLPLALAIVAARAALRPDHPLATVARQLGEAVRRLDAFTDADPVGDVRAVFSWSYRTISEPAARLFRLLGLHPGPHVTLEAAAALCGVPVRETAGHLAELVAAHLVSELDGEHFWHHDLLHAYASELALEKEPEPERDKAIRRALDHYLNTAYHAARLLDPNRELAEPVGPSEEAVVAALTDRDSAMAWLDTEHECLQAVIEWAGRRGFDRQVCRFAAILVGYLDLRGHWDDGVDTFLAALEAARRLGDAPEEARIRGRLSRAYSMLHRHDEARAELRQALAISSELGDLPGQALAHHHLAFMFGRLRRFREALDHVRQELELARAIGHRRMEAMALNGIGWFHAQLGELEEAAEHCRAALVIHGELGNRYGEASTWDSLGYVRHRQGRHEEAVGCYEQSVALYRVLGDAYCLADTLTRLGDTQAAAGRAWAATEAYREARQIFMALGRPEASWVDAKMKELESEFASG